MFVPPVYRTEDERRIDAVIRDHPLALLTTNGDDAPHATHLPIIPESPRPGIVGATLLGHLNRANPHWSALADGTTGWLVFTGPNGYVTPSVYGTTPAAPTWNFVSVHLKGTIELLDGLENTIRVVSATVATYEERFGTGWSPDGSLEYFHRIGDAVGAFRFTVTAVDAQYKLSQDKDEATRAHVIDWFAESRRGNQRDLADAMRANEMETYQ
ncbi:FMN-binding negative transcriptional regulator [Stackebrandtia soli]|uniref:FMN-binding negative transcriptional regulator n=1 Tax=Stackebrandtia soli TaxID=1892856 RepID=UPI0039E8E7E6